MLVLGRPPRAIYYQVTACVTWLHDSAVRIETGWMNMTTRPHKLSLLIVALFSVFSLLPLSGCEKERLAWEQVPAILQQIVPPVFPQRDFNIMDFGARGDGLYDCSDAIRKAISACADSGGGRVLIPEGNFLTGAIHLRSNVNLHLAEGATLLFSVDPDDFTPLVPTRYEGMACINYSPFIYAFEQENIAITGSGTLDGQADRAVWWEWKELEVKPRQVDGKTHDADRDALLRMMADGVPPEQRIFGPGHFIRPNFIQPYQCRNVLIEGVKIKNSPMWEIHPVLCTNVTVRNVHIESHGPNNDGCNPESCKNVLIENCWFDTGDDCIAIKSGRNEDGRRINVPSENIVIRGCTMKDGHGGVVIGSEISGGCRNVFAEDCVMDSPNLDRALRIKTNSLRGGVVENIHMRNVAVGEVKEAVVLIDFNYMEGDVGQHTPVVRNVHIANVSSRKSRYALHLIGYERSPIQNVSLTACQFEGVQSGNILQHVEGLQLQRVTINGVPVERPDAWAVRMAESIMKRNPGAYDDWDYVTGTVLSAFEELWRETGDSRYFDYIRSTVDSVVDTSGHIADYHPQDFNIDEIREGCDLIFLHRQTGEAHYKTAADQLRQQLRDHPRTRSGGFWHKLRYPWQMWLDGLYMGAPFYAEYAAEYNEPAAFDDIVHQFTLCERMTRDAGTGLLCHGWDESREQNWADSQTGRSANFWGRGLGWYTMALVDVLDFIPAGHSGRDSLINILRRVAPAMASVQDKETGLWWQVLDQGPRAGNYLESSVSAMFVYTLAKGVRLGYLDSKYLPVAQKGFDGMITEFIAYHSDGTISLTKTCTTAGLGYGRDGSYDYYVNQTEYRDNDGKGLGPFMLASIELELRRPASTK